MAKPFHFRNLTQCPKRERNSTSRWRHVHHHSGRFSEKCFTLADPDPDTGIERIFVRSHDTGSIVPEIVFPILSSPRHEWIGLWMNSKFPGRATSIDPNGFVDWANRIAKQDDYSSIDRTDYKTLCLHACLSDMLFRQLPIMIDANQPHPGPRAIPARSRMPVSTRNRSLSNALRPDYETDFTSTYYPANASRSIGPRTGGRDEIRSPQFAPISEDTRRLRNGIESGGAGMSAPPRPGRKAPIPVFENCEIGSPKTRPDWCITIRDEMTSKRKQAIAARVNLGGR